MSIGTNLIGRLRNTSLPLSSGMMPLYEAVVNSIHAIEDAGIEPKFGRITVKVIRDGQGALFPRKKTKQKGPEAQGNITGFSISDNGIGFTRDNMDSFLTLDSEYKASRGGRGVGRLLWLKAFQKARVQSTYREDGVIKELSFEFDAEQGVHGQRSSSPEKASSGTVTTLSGFNKRYREASSKRATPIARHLLEHCLWYFVREGGGPIITVVDEDEVINLDDVYEEYMVSHTSSDSTIIKGIKFNLIHFKVSARSSRNHSIAFCAANRLVTQESIVGKIPGLHGKLMENGTQFVYECYVSSPLLDERVRSERTGFDIEESPFDLLESDDISQKEIREAVLVKASNFLKEFLAEKCRRGKEKVIEFVANKAPRYRPILNRIPDGDLAVDPKISDRDLDLLLNGHLFEISSKILSDGHDLMQPKPGEAPEDYQDRIHNYLEIVKDVKKSDLASYVAHRRVVLDMLERSIQKGSDGKYAREDLIHDLIMPRGCTSDEVQIDAGNLWLIDERLAFHDYLASDKTISSMPVTSSKSAKRPDIAGLNVYDNPVLVSDSSKLPLASIVVVELKRPMRNDAASGEDKNPLEQALGYLDRIRNGGVETRTGRPIPGAEKIPGFCYTICDITPSVERQCKNFNMTRTDDGSGYFGYNINYQAYQEVISFDRLVNAAKERNRAFFDKLGLPST